MTIKEAFADLLETSIYKTICKQKDAQGAKYRVYKGRYYKDNLKDLAMVAFLLEHGYSITVGLPKKKK